MSLPSGFRDLKAYQLSYKLAMKVFRESITSRHKNARQHDYEAGAIQWFIAFCRLPSAACLLSLCSQLLTDP